MFDSTRLPIAFFNLFFFFPILFVQWRNWTPFPFRRAFAFFSSLNLVTIYGGWCQLSTPFFLSTFDTLSLSISPSPSGTIYRFDCSALGDPIQSRAYRPPFLFARPWFPLRGHEISIYHPPPS